MKITERRDCVITGTLPIGTARPLEVDAEIVFLHARRTGLNPEIQMELKITPEPTLGDIVGVRDWDQAMTALIMGLLLEISPQPQEAIQEVGAEMTELDPGIFFRADPA